MPEGRAPDVLGEIVGWRAWRLIGNETFPLLASATHSGTHWHPNRWTLATCAHDFQCRHSLDDGVPGENCTCGLYAARDRSQLVDLGYGEEREPGQIKVIGEVGLAGKVIAGTQGWRAEKGRIRRLYVPFGHWRYVEPLARLYRVPVQLDSTLQIEPTFGSERSS